MCRGKSATHQIFQMQSPQSVDARDLANGTQIANVDPTPWEKVAASIQSSLLLAEVSPTKTPQDSEADLDN